MNKKHIQDLDERIVNYLIRYGTSSPKKITTGLLENGGAWTVDYGIFDPSECSNLATHQIMEERRYAVHLKVIQRLNKLKKSGLVERVREGKVLTYMVNQESLWRLSPSVLDLEVEK